MIFVKSGEWLELRVTRKQEGRTVKALLTEQVGWPASVVKELLSKEGIVVNKEAVSGDAVLKSGDRLRCHLFPEEEYGFVPEMLPLDVLYEDDHLLVVNKEAGRKVHPNEPDETDTLMNAIAFHYQMQGLQTRVRILHRLDQETSGAILFPKHALAQKLLDAMLAAREISREYWAVVEGRVKQRHGLIDAPIGRDRYHATRRRVSKTGKAAQTEYWVEERFAKATLVRCKLHTGRTHQIRVHLADLGHPLLGDELYGGSRALIGRQALHAKFLRFVHPFTGEELEVEATLPGDLESLLEKVRR
ncbi:MAG TPA: RluA family pseudouridine synthase [Bacilli bacterium]|nr:RluA family pseudouridine synthase [Bacilli bacterium]